VAYEHHIRYDGSGYPNVRYARKLHRVTQVFQVCDVYDALRTTRPYRGAWESEKILAYMEERSGLEFEGEAAHAFTQMMREWEPQMTEIQYDDATEN